MTSVDAAHESLRGYGHLRMLGQIFSLRSLLFRQQGHFAEAVQDPWTASTYWLVEGDLCNLFSVHHDTSPSVRSSTSTMVATAGSVQPESTWEGRPTPPIG
jgi:hypothetical protein